MDGGAGGRICVTMVSESNKKVFTLPNKGSMGGRLGNSWLIQGLSPLAMQSVSNCAHTAGDPPHPNNLKMKPPKYFIIARTQPGKE